MSLSLVILILNIIVLLLLLRAHSKLRKFIRRTEKILLKE